MILRAVALASLLCGTIPALALQDRPSNPDPFPSVASKKGLQVQMVDDALALGIRHAALNVNISHLVAVTNSPGTIPWMVEGTAVHLKAAALSGLDS